jgi:hypothetical protein
LTRDPDLTETSAVNSKEKRYFLLTVFGWRTPRMDAGSGPA